MMNIFTFAIILCNFYLQDACLICSLAQQATRNNASKTFISGQFQAGAIFNKSINYKLGTNTFSQESLKHDQPNIFKFAFLQCNFYLLDTYLICSLAQQATHNNAIQDFYFQVIVGRCIIFEKTINYKLGTNSIFLGVTQTRSTKYFQICFHFVHFLFAGYPCSQDSELNVLPLCYLGKFTQVRTILSQTVLVDFFVTKILANLQF